MYNCECCKYSSNKKTDFNKHLKTNKHLANDKLNNNKYLVNKLELLTTEMEKLKNANNQNTHTIVKEARNIKKSLLSILNSNFKDTPSIDYIDEEEFRIHLEEEYNLKLDDENNRLFMRIFNDFEKRKLVHSMSKVILRFLKKEDQKSQSVFNIDSARGNYANKIEDIWHNDKKRYAT